MKLDMADFLWTVLYISALHCSFVRVMCMNAAGSVQSADGCWYKTDRW